MKGETDDILCLWFSILYLLHYSLDQFLTYVRTYKEPIINNYQIPIPNSGPESLSLSLYFFACLWLSVCLFLSISSVSLYVSLPLSVSLCACLSFSPFLFLSLLSCLIYSFVRMQAILSITFERDYWTERFSNIGNEEVLKTRLATGTTSALFRYVSICIVPLLLTLFTVQTVIYTQINEHWCLKLEIYANFKKHNFCVQIKVPEKSTGHSHDYNINLSKTGKFQICVVFG